MKKQGKILLKQRRYAKTFKKSIVQDFEGGRFSIQQLSNLPGMSIQSIYNWIFLYRHLGQRATGLRLPDRSQIGRGASLLQAYPVKSLFALL
jgi:transposase-like protein